MKISEYLNKEKEEMPLWLKHYVPGQKLDFDEILSGRVLYYPGSGDDGEPLRTVNPAHFAHVFFYIDYGIREDVMKETLTKEGALKGYRLIDMRNFEKDDLIPKGWKPHVMFIKSTFHRFFSDTFDNPDFYYGILAVFEREAGYDDSHGPERISLIAMYADGIATYDAVFANYGRAPAVLVLQDHGLGGNYNRFGHGGLMEEIAVRTNTFPKYILCADYNTHVWPGYEKIKECDAVVGGMHHQPRWLYKKVK